MILEPIHRRLLIGQTAGGLVLNFLMNGALAFATFPPVAALPLWARGNCVAGDTIGTSFFLPLTTCLVITPLVRRAVRKGGVPPIPRATLPSYARWLPVNFAGRGAAVGLVAALTVALAALGVLTAAGVAGMTRTDVTLWKAIYTALLGVVVTPLFGLRALADPRA